MHTRVGYIPGLELIVGLIFVKDALCTATKFVFSKPVDLCVGVYKFFVRSSTPVVSQEKTDVGKRCQEIKAWQTETTRDEGRSTHTIREELFEGMLFCLVGIESDL